MACYQKAMHSIDKPTTASIPRMLKRKTRILKAKKERYISKRLIRWVIYYPEKDCWAAGKRRAGESYLTKFDLAWTYKSAGSCTQFIRKHPGGIAMEKKKTEVETLEALKKGGRLDYENQN
jgi:uncharacterized membrane protein